MSPSDAYDLVVATQSNRYWVVRDRSKWFRRYKVVTSDDRRDLFSGSRRECQVVADALSIAFFEGGHLTAQLAERNQ